MYNYPYGDNQQINLNWIISEIIALHQRLDPDYTAPTFTQIYPFSDTQQLNLDWILTELKALKELAPTPPPTELIDEIGQALIAGAYDATTSYQKNDYIVQDGKLYRANAATTGTFDPTKWNEVMLGNDLAIITRWADATNTFLNSLAASNVANDSSVTGPTVKDALDTLKTATDAAVTNVKYNGGYLKKTISGADSNIIKIEDSPTNDSAKLPSSKAVYNEATTRENNDTALQEQIVAYIQTDTTAARTYYNGDYFMLNGTLYRVITTIQSGSSITIGTNARATNIASELNTYIKALGFFYANDAGLTGQSTVGKFTLPVGSWLFLERVYASAAGEIGLTINGGVSIHTTAMNGSYVYGFDLVTINAATEFEFGFNSRTTATVKQLYVEVLPMIETRSSFT